MQVGDLIRFILEEPKIRYYLILDSKVNKLLCGGEIIKVGAIGNGPPVCFIPRKWVKVVSSTNGTK